MANSKVVFPNSYDEICVAFDLETTGLDSNRDTIIEIGAVRFKGKKELDTYHTFVNPLRELTKFILGFTGITQKEVDSAPPFGAIASELIDFIGKSPIVGHNVAFDLSFLNSNGVRLENVSYDTQDMATVFLPMAKRYALSALAEEFEIGNEVSHRALADARTSYLLFTTLVDLANEQTPEVLAALASVSDRSNWPLRYLLKWLATNQTDKPSRGSHSDNIMGVNVGALGSQLSSKRSLKVNTVPPILNKNLLEEMFAENGPLSKSFPSYEQRLEQVQMAQAVADTFNNGRHLIIEAGTGVGKSIAYLLPSIFFTLMKGNRVVISTNTINLQQQLVFKDLPTLVQSLRLSSKGKVLDELRYTHVKGRGNYLCLRRWLAQAQSQTMSADEARMMAKTIVWLQCDTDGDREELNIPVREAHIWDRLSARGAGDCGIAKNNSCFLRAVQSRAQSSHIVVVNHSLLLADLARGGGLLPSYNHLIIDEAHHLEEEASRQFGYQLTAVHMDELMVRLSRILQSTKIASRTSMKDEGILVSWKQAIQFKRDELERTLPGFEEAWGRLASGVTEFLQRHNDNSGGRGLQLRVTRASRAQPEWSNLELLWEHFNEINGVINRYVSELIDMLESVEIDTLIDQVIGLRGWVDDSDETRGWLRSFIVQPEDSMVYWMYMTGRETTPTLNSSPLDVGPLLDEKLFSKKESVILTSATLGIKGSFEYLRRSVGISDSEELMLGSPFDYKKSALLLTTRDMPEPLQAGYHDAVIEAISKIAKAVGGGVLGLFTSNASMQLVRNGLKTALERDGIDVLSQGFDGPPRAVVSAAMKSSKAVLLGTSSLREGVDLPSHLLRVLVLTRLPFPVPTDPLFAARSERYNDPFMEYGIPQAVLRFRQGFGRLIRSRAHRGVVVVLDSRIAKRKYGQTFLESIPGCTVNEVAFHDLGVKAGEWLV